MNRETRRAIGRLKQVDGDWEVGFQVNAAHLAGGDMVSLLVVLDAATGAPRLVAPVVAGGLAEALAEAFLQPMPPHQRGRPRRLLCGDDALAAALRAELGRDVVVERVAAVPGVDEAFRQILGPPPVEAPGVDVELAAWAAVVPAFAAAAPWRFMDDSVTLRFSGPAWRDAVGVVIGQAGEQRGLALYANAADLERARGEGVVPDALVLFLDPPDELGLQDQAACARKGFDGPLLPRVVAIRDGLPHAASEAEQRLLLAAAQCVVALAGPNPAALVGGAPMRPVSTCLGEIVAGVMVDRDRDVPPLTGATHTAWWMMKRVTPRAAPRLTLVIKLARREAVALGRRLAGADRVTMRRAEVVVWRGDEPLGWCALPDSDLQLAQVGRLALIVSAGGAQRARIDVDDFVFERELWVGEVPPNAPRHDSVFDEPREAWPTGAEQLVALVGRLRTTPRADRLEVYEGAAAAWNAVTFADFGDDPSLLERLYAVDTAHGELRELVARRRALFGGDPRVLANVRLEGVGAQERLVVETYALKGGPTGQR
jgi:hypothetical protein